MSKGSITQKGPQVMRPLWCVMIKDRFGS